MTVMPFILNHPVPLKNISVIVTHKSSASQISNKILDKALPLL